MSKKTERLTQSKICKFFTDGQIILTAYICVLFAGLSLYAPYGYYDLGENKFILYRLVASIFSVLLIPAVVSRIKNRSVKPCLSDMMLMIISVLLTVSFIASGYHGISLWGIDGWRTGYLTYLLIFLGFIACRSIGAGKYTDIILIFIESVSSAVFVLSLLNRFGIYPFPSMISTDTSFLGTIGNINWYSGYLAVTIPLIIADVIAHRRSKIRLALSCAALFLGFGTLIAQGSDTSSLILIMTFVTLLSLVFLRRIELSTFIGIIFIFFLALEAYGLLLLRPTSTYTYSTDVIWLRLAVRHCGAMGIAVCVIILLILSLVDRQNVYKTEPAGKIMLFIAPVILLLLFIIVVSLTFPSTFDGMLKAVNRCTGISTGDAFGNGRGIIYRISGVYLRELPISRLFTGVGPDMYYPYASLNDNLSAMIYGTFGDMRLTNAHSMLITAVIEKGIPYTVFLILFFISVYFSLAAKTVKGDRSTSLRSAAGLMVLASVAAVYLFTFPTVVSLPFFFMVTGVCLRSDK